MTQHGKVKPIPDGYHTLTPYLGIRGSAKALDFYKKAFGAEELFRIPGPTPDSVGHAEIRIGDSIVMLSEEMPQMGMKGPQSLGGTPVTLVLYVKDVDASVKQAVAAGATIVRPVQNQFYGDRSGVLSDPFGHMWCVSTHVEDVPPDELARRAAAHCK
jgi:PhnB protein